MMITFIPDFSWDTPRGKGKLFCVRPLALPNHARSCGRCQVCTEELSVAWEQLLTSGDSALMAAVPMLGALLNDEYI